MQFRILGEVEVQARRRHRVALGGRKPRAVLAVLLLHANEPVSAERLAVGAVGRGRAGAARRRRCRSTSRGCARRSATPTCSTTTPAGYRLRVRPGELDAERFEQRVEDGRRRARGRATPEQAAALLREALALWRGPPLADLAFEPFAQAEIARLEEQRLRRARGARRGRSRRRPARRRSSASCGELVAEHPTRERLRGAADARALPLRPPGRGARGLPRGAPAARRRGRASSPGRSCAACRRRSCARTRRSTCRPPAPSCRASSTPRAAPPLVGPRRRARAGCASAGSGARPAPARLVACSRARTASARRRLAAELAGEVARAGGASCSTRPAAGRPRRVRRGARARARRGAARRWSSSTTPTRGRPSRAARSCATRSSRACSRSVLVLAIAERAAALDAATTLAALEPLDADAVRAIAARCTAGRPTTSRSSGCSARAAASRAACTSSPSRWARREAARRVGAVAGRTAAGRAELRSMEAELAGGVVELQAAASAPRRRRRRRRPWCCPFKGLASFDVADAPYFFGRERLVAELVARLVGAPLLGVVGPSGSGKSSVAARRAAAARWPPACCRGSEQWTQVVMRPGRAPAARARSAAATRGLGRRMVLAVDQFEETFTACRDEAERAAFIAELVHACESEPPTVVVRGDPGRLLRALRGVPGAVAAARGQPRAGRRDAPRRAAPAVERPRAARRPARRARARRRARAPTSRAEPGALPLLSTALLELWQRRDGRRLRLATYEETGGVRGRGRAATPRTRSRRLDAHQQAVARGACCCGWPRSSAEGGVERRRVPLARARDGTGDDAPT